MKKILVLLLSALMAVSLFAGCAEKEPAPADPVVVPESPPAPAPESPVPAP